MWRPEFGLAMFWFIPIFLGFIIAFVLLRYSDRKLRGAEPGDEEDAEKTAPPKPTGGQSSGGASGS